MKAIVLVAAVATFAGCNVINCTEGTGEMVTKSFPQSSFESFDLSSSADVELIQSDRNEIEVRTYQNLIDKIRIENKGGEVDIDFEGCINMKEGMKVRVYFTDLHKVTLSGSGNISSRGNIKTENFSIEIEGSGDANIESETTNLSAEIMGSGDISLRGKTNSFKGSINGSGNINGTGLTSSSAHISINGSGDATMGSCTNLTSSVNGSGNVNCLGK